MKLIPLTQDKFAQVDDEDFEWLSQWKWRYDRGYAGRRTKVNGKRCTIFMHREIAQTPDGMETDHRKTGETLNNQRSNLRVCTVAQNQANRGLAWNNTSGYKGVSYHRAKKKWRARIKAGGGKLIQVGYFPNAEDAAHAYDAAARQLHGEFAYLNC